MQGIASYGIILYNINEEVVVSMIRTIVKKTIHAIHLRSKKNRLTVLFNSGLPQGIRSALEFIALGKFDAEARDVAMAAESRRKEIAGQGDREVAIWYSPKPGSSGSDSGATLRPLPGKVLQFTMARIARTGKDQKWGTVLYLIARDFRSAVGLELGSCAGISAIYLASAPSVKKLITVEGSKALADIARESLRPFRNVTVLTGLFDEAIDDLYSLGEKIDLAYIDGHHEKIATIHYFTRLLPHLSSGAVVIFDDISWSRDMREAWVELSTKSEFSHALDLGTIGVCVLKNESENKSAAPAYWDLQPIVGQCPIGDPVGWKA